MAQQQPRREEFRNAPRVQEQERDRDVRKNEVQEESDSWKDEFGTRAAGALDPAAPYAFATGYGAPVGSAGVDDFAHSGGPPPHHGAPAAGGTGIYENTSTTTGTAEFGTDDDPVIGTGGGPGSRSRNRNRNRDNMNRNRGRDQI